MSLSRAAPDADSASGQQTGASQQTGARSAPGGQGGLDGSGKAWAAQLLLLVMQAYTVMGDEDLPDWISRLIKGPSDRDLIPGGCLLACVWLHVGRSITCTLISTSTTCCMSAQTWYAAASKYRLDESAAVLASQCYISGGAVL